MFDFHMHTTVSYDGRASATEMALAAKKAGLSEICFTDHMDYDPLPNPKRLTFTPEEYAEAYDHLNVPGLTICKGFEFGMLPDNREEFHRIVQSREFDFVLGSVHFVNDLDIYFAPFWGKWPGVEGELQTMNATLKCVMIHDDFDVLAHLTYVSKCPGNVTHRPILYNDYIEIFDEILKVLAQKGKGLEVNTSGVDRCGYYLPTMEYLKRFKELGGEIVTVGSDAHDPWRVGQYCDAACQMVRDIFGYVCTFQNREPVFHK